MRLDGLPEPITCPECGEEMRYQHQPDLFWHPGPCPLVVFAEHVDEKVRRGHVPATRLTRYRSGFGFNRSQACTVWIPLRYA